MAKRFAISCFIVLGVCIFLVAGFALVLFLAPGFSAFGIKYIAQNTHVVNEKITITEEIGSFNGSVIVETNEIPIEVIFTEGYSYQIEYYEDYNGLTTSKFDDPSISVVRDTNGNAYVKVNEFESFLYESSTSERYIKVLIPLASIVGDTSEYKTNLTLLAGSSNIEFSKELEADERIPTFNLVRIETTGKIEYGTHIKATTFNYSTNSTINVGKSNTSTIDAENYILESREGKIEIARPVVGDVSAKTKNGRIKLLSCKNLTVSTDMGNLSCVDDDKLIEVSGVVNIKTKSGSVKLGDIAGTANNVIKTSSGSVKLGKLNKATITTTSGSIEIKSVGNATLKTNMGRVEVEEVLEAITVDTKRGNVYLGGDKMTVNNPTVETRLGNVTIYSASEVVNITSLSGDVKLNNTNSEDITITSGGKLKATNLKGAVTINAYDDVDIEIDDITKDITLVIYDSVENVKIEALNNAYRDIRYLMKGKSVTRYGDNGTGTFSQLERSASLDTSMIGSGPLLKVTKIDSGKSKAKISLYMQV